MHELVDRIRAGLDAGRYPNESAVSTSIVMPILRALGWDASDPSEVIREFANPRGRVDIALASRANRPSIFVEVERVGQSADAYRQLFEYAFHEGVPIAVLTDGRIWNFYLPGQQGSYEDRRVYQLDILERDTAEAIHRLSRYLEKHRISSGDALADAQRDYTAGASRREAELTLPKAWCQILEEPDGLLMELVRDRTEALCGHKPSDAALEAFIKGRLGGQPQIVENVRPARSRTAVAIGAASPVIANSSAPTMPASAPDQPNRWRVAQQSGQERSGSDAMVALLTALFTLFPDRQETMAAAVRTRGRNNIARVVEEIYPNRPEVARRQHRSLPDGWFVGTNESSGTKTRIINQATKAAGLSMGKDVEFEL